MVSSLLRGLLVIIRRPQPMSRNLNNTFYCRFLEMGSVKTFQKPVFDLHFNDERFDIKTRFETEVKETNC